MILEQKLTSNFSLTVHTKTIPTIALDPALWAGTNLKSDFLDPSTPPLWPFWAGPDSILAFINLILNPKFEKKSIEYKDNVFLVWSPFESLAMKRERLSKI